MDIYEIMTELSKHTKQEIEFALTTTMLQGKIDFLSVNKSYVECLEQIREDQLNQLVEANGLLLHPFLGKKVVKSKDSDKTKGKSHYRYTQESLYWLNQSRMFNMQSTNKEFNYDEDFGKSQCVYERNKNNNW